MELRHLRYFIAVAEAGSFTLAAEHKLHTAQPSLSRQIRDLENEVGTELLNRSARGVKLTAAGRVFLDHARLALGQVEAAATAARRAAQAEPKALAIGFLSGTEPEWLPVVLQALREEYPDIATTISSQHSPQLAEGLAAGKLDAAFMRAERGYPGLAYRVLAREPLIAVLPSDHRLAARHSIGPLDLVGETLIGMADQAPVLRELTEDYLGRSGIDLQPAHRVEYISMAMSLVASTGGVVLLPEFTRNFLTPMLVSRPLEGEPPVIDLVFGYHTANASSLLRHFVSKLDELFQFRATGR